MEASTWPPSWDSMGALDIIWRSRSMSLTNVPYQRRNIVLVAEADHMPELVEGDSKDVVATRSAWSPIRNPTR